MKKPKPIYKNVKIILSVPNSDYCWDGKFLCPYMDLSDGTPWCTVDMGGVTFDKKKHIKKTNECLELKEEK